MFHEDIEDIEGLGRVRLVGLGEQFNLLDHVRDYLLVNFPLAWTRLTDTIQNYSWVLLYIIITKCSRFSRFDFIRSVQEAMTHFM